MRCELIDALRSQIGSFQSGPLSASAGSRLAAVIAALIVAFALAHGSPDPAHAGQAASGDLYFDPCASCHPVDPDATRAFPSGFEGHEIVLVGHDRLGEESEACLVCHDDPSRDPGKLKLIDGSLVDIAGDVSGVCFRCHSERYRDWQAGTHGTLRPSCTALGCHDPHAPAWTYGGPLLPLAGTGFQVRVLSDRQPFTPIAGPPLPAPVETPGWLVVVTALGALASIGLIGFMVRGGSTR